MEVTQENVVARLEAAATALERTLACLEERQAALTGEVERITATVEQGRREADLEEKLAKAEAELEELKAAAGAAARPAPAVTQRRTAAVTEMLAKHGIAGEGPVDVRTLDQALNGLSLEQRIAIKSQLARAGAIA
jgi:chromosome segregation ATPase